MSKGKHKPKRIDPRHEEGEEVDMRIEMYEWQSPLVRLDKMERTGRAALADRTVRLFRPLIRVPEVDGGVTWRTPRANSRT